MRSSASARRLDDHLEHERRRHRGTNRGDVGFDPVPHAGCRQAQVDDHVDLDGAAAQRPAGLGRLHLGPVGAAGNPITVAQRRPTRAARRPPAADGWARCTPCPTPSSAASPHSIATCPGVAAGASRVWSIIRASSARCIEPSCHPLDRFASGGRTPTRCLTASGRSAASWSGADHRRRPSPRPPGPDHAPRPGHRTAPPSAMAMDDLAGILVYEATRPLRVETVRGHDAARHHRRRPRRRAPDGRPGAAGRAGPAPRRPALPPRLPHRVHRRRPQRGDPRCPSRT